MFIDTHAHIYLDRFEEDFDEVIEKALASNVKQIYMPNIDVETIDSVFLCAEKYPNVCFPMVGLHPCSVSKEWESQLSALRPYLKREGVIAVGEIGIDLFWDKTLEKEQRLAFNTQIEWALENDLPIVIHSRNAIDISIEIVRDMQNGDLKGVFHCFDQSLDHAKQILDLGFLVGIGGVSTYKKNNAIREVISQIPLTSIILETDAPYLPPVPYRGKRNEPSYIPIIAKQVAELHNRPISNIQSITSQNAQALFNL